MLQTRYALTTYRQTGRDPMARFEMPYYMHAEFEHRQFEQQVVIRLANGREITPRGFTHCILKTESGMVLAEALAWCRDTDQFNKSIGRQISQGRALKAWMTGENTLDRIMPYVLSQH
jgi:hypothetical protein